MTVAIAMQGEDDVSPIMACTLESLIHGAWEVADATALPLANDNATLTPLAMEPHESYIS